MNYNSEVDYNGHLINTNKKEVKDLVETYAKSNDIAVELVTNIVVDILQAEFNRTPKYDDLVDRY